MSSSLMKTRTVATLLGAVAITGGFVAHRAQADEWDKKTILTINQPIQVTDTVLQPGQYVFRLADSQSDRHIVQIFNADQTQLINTILAIPNYHLQVSGKSQFLFWETPPGNPPALRAWFYPGDNFGQEFKYPKQVAMAQAPPPPPPAPAPLPAAPQPAPEPAAQPAPPAPAPQAMTTPQQPAPVEMAQNAPPPPPPAPQAEPQPPAPESLPKTGSSYPMIGLGGLLSLGAFSLLRLKRVA